MNGLVGESRLSAILTALPVLSCFRPSTYRRRGRPSTTQVCHFPQPGSLSGLGDTWTSKGLFHTRDPSLSKMSYAPHRSLSPHTQEGHLSTYFAFEVCLPSCQILLSDGSCVVCTSTVVYAPNPLRVPEKRVLKDVGSYVRRQSRGLTPSTSL